MRLEDWQKFIESQFLDDEAEKPQKLEAQTVLPLEEAPAPPPAPQKTLVAEAPRSASAVVAVTPSGKNERPTQTPPEATEPTKPPVPEARPMEPTAPPTSQITVEERALLEAPLPGVAKASEISSTLNAPKIPLPRGQAPAPPSPERGTSAPTRAATSFTPSLELDAEIPAFERYLPTFRGGEKVEALPTHPTAEPARKSQSLAKAAPSAAPSEPEPAPAPHEAESDADKGAPTRRTPKTRARHARNVRPDNVPSGLSASDLWAKVPRHVQTLLALERMEEEKEIAQFSYKRPFQEKRRELIERILDPILSLEDTARLLNVCPTTVRRYTNKGILTHYRKEPERSTRNSVSPEKETRQRRFRLSDILAFLETQQAAIEADRARESRRSHGATTRDSNGNGVAQEPSAHTNTL